MQYKYIYISRNVEMDEHAGKPIYYIFNKRSKVAIGQIIWYPQWARWVARFDESSIWSKDCLEDVASAIVNIVE